MSSSTTSGPLGLGAFRAALLRQRAPEGASVAGGGRGTGSLAGADAARGGPSERPEAGHQPAAGFSLPHPGQLPAAARRSGELPAIRQHPDLRRRGCRSGPADRPDAGLAGGTH